MASGSSSSASAPGSVMILGEHAVLHARRALVGAVDRRIGVTLRHRDDRTIDIESRLGRWTGDIDEMKDSGPFRFVLAALKSGLGRLQAGLDVRITSDVPETVGLGSSAAVTVATLAALHDLAGDRLDPDKLHREATEVIRGVQGLGSGADAAAAVYGGIVLYRADPLLVRVLEQTAPATLIYSGAKTPTPEVVRFVESRRSGDPERFERIFDRIDESIDVAAQAIEAGDPEALGRVLDANQDSMSEMGLSNDTLDDILRRLRDLPGVYGAKISGSGLGDCVLAIGSVDAEGWPYEIIPMQFTTEGVRVD